MRSARLLLITALVGCALGAPAMAASTAAEARSKAKALLKDQRGVLDTLDRLDREVNAVARELEGVRIRVDTLTGERIQLESQKRALTGEVGAAREAMERRLRARYRMDAVGTLRILLGARDVTDLVKRRALLRRVLGADLSLLRDLNRKETALGEVDRQLTTTLSSLDTQQRRLETRRQQLEEERLLRQEMLRQIRSERRLLLELVRQKEARAQALDRDTGTASGRGGAFGSARGQMPWPIRGRIIRGFGRQVDPELGTETFHKGLTIDAPMGAPVRAVLDGAVVYSGWYKGFGNMVIVDHGGGEYTLYAHLHAITKARGEQVKQGDPIGNVGDTGSLSGPQLYFELRRKNQPLNPRRFLRSLQ